MSYIAENISSVRENIRRAEIRSGRQPGSVRLVAVSKFKPASDVQAALEAGVIDFGENRVQEMLMKQEELAAKDINWHFIGKLQTNKVKQIIGRTVLIHSLDSWNLAQEIQKRSESLKTRVLVEVNVAGEATKSGLEPEETIPFIQQAADSLKQIRIMGLMTMAPPADDPEEVRWVFRELRQLSERCSKMTIPGVDMKYLSMGMSGDYQIAVEEGANIVRVGSSIFGKR